MPAKAEGVIDDDVDRLLDGLIGNVVEVALRVGKLVVDRGRELSVRDGKSGGRIHRL